MKAAIRSILTTIATTGLAMAPVAAAEPAFDGRQEVNDFVLGAATVVMMHEVGHMLIDELDLPVLGRDEDAADTIASLVMLNQEGEDEQRGLDYLHALATTWFLYAEDDEFEEISDARMADEHSLSRQRAFTIVCMMHGSEQTLYDDIAERYGLEERRQERCETEYQKAESSFLRLIANHLLIEGREQTSSYSVTYEDTTTFAAIAARLKQARMLEEIAEAVYEDIVMPRDIAFAARECGMANAYYSEEDADVVFCYEFADELEYLYLEAFGGDGATDPDSAVESLMAGGDADPS